MKSEKELRKFRRLASFGKRQEFIAIAELLKRGFDVYIPLVDDQQIDCVIRKNINGTPVYIDIQIKARSKDCKPNDAGRFAAMEIINPRRNYFFIFYSEQLDKYWIIPSEELEKIAYQNKKGKNIGKYHINLAGYSKENDEVYPLPKFEIWEDNFKILEDYGEKNKSDKLEKLMTLEEVSEYLRLSLHTIYKMAREGKIPAVKIAIKERRLWKL